jgi:predicted transcriptional regulator
MSNVVQIKPKKDTLQVSEKKWGKQVIKVGFNIVPSLLFRAQKRLGLTSQQLVVLLHLTDFWWEYGRSPWPSVNTLAERMGLKRRQVQRIMTELEKAGLVERIGRTAKHKGKLSNAYDLSGLVSRLKELAPEFLEADKKAKELKKEVAIPKQYRINNKEDIE